MNASEAARRLGISVKALRLYEQRGLLAPIRTDAGWRAYGPNDLERASEIVALRALGFSLAQVERVLTGDARGLEPALAAHQGTLEARLRELAGVLDRLRGLRAELARGRAPTASELARLLTPPPGLHVAFDLPWPWGGERFELRDIGPLTYITGPLGSGKTRLAMRLAEELGGVFVGLDRRADPSAALKVRPTVDLLVQDGATESAALIDLLAALDQAPPVAVVVDLIEQGLDRATQEALIAHLRRRSAGAPPLFVMTRSSSILDLDAVGAGETILFCPANHSPPVRVVPHPGTPGYEALASCLATPEVRARSEGVRAVRR
nr:MerR family transcriptional regulator [Reyranella sp. MMS21-HV4-11]